MRETSGEGDRGRISAAFLGSPGALASGAGEVVGEHAEAEELEVAEMAALGEGLEGVARAYALRALEDLGWERRAGARVEPEELRRQLRVVEEHRGLLGRLLGLLADGELLAADEGSGGWLVVSGSEDPLPAGIWGSGGAFRWICRAASCGEVEFGLLRRCGEELSEVLRGRADGLELLFGGSRARRICIATRLVPGWPTGWLRRWCRGPFPGCRKAAGCGLWRWARGREA